jgi:hypothetical protein
MRVGRVADWHVLTRHRSCSQQWGKSGSKEDLFVLEQAQSVCCSASEARATALVGRAARAGKVGGQESAHAPPRPQSNLGGAQPDLPKSVISLLSLPDLSTNHSTHSTPALPTLNQSSWPTSQPACTNCESDQQRRAKSDLNLAQLTVALLVISAYSKAFKLPYFAFLEVDGDKAKLHNVQVEGRRASGWVEAKYGAEVRLCFRNEMDEMADDLCQRGYADGI